MTTTTTSSDAQPLIDHLSHGQAAMTDWPASSRSGLKARYQHVADAMLRETPPRYFR